MMFARHLRERVRQGQITCSVRIWRNARVRAGGVYPMDEGRIVVESIREIGLADVDDDLARKSGFDDVTDLLATARHGSGTNVYLIEFTYAGPRYD
jgi:hypothetical protein